MEPARKRQRSESSGDAGAEFVVPLLVAANIFASPQAAHQRSVAVRTANALWEAARKKFKLNYDILSQQQHPLNEDGTPSEALRAAVSKLSYRMEQVETEQILSLGFELVDRNAPGSFWDDPLCADDGCNLYLWKGAYLPTFGKDLQTSTEQTQAADEEDEGAVKLYECSKRNGTDETVWYPLSDRLGHVSSLAQRLAVTAWALRGYKEHEWSGIWSDYKAKAEAAHKYILCKYGCVPAISRVWVDGISDPTTYVRDLASVKILLSPDPTLSTCTVVAPESPEDTTQEQVEQAVNESDVPPQDDATLTYPEVQRADLQVDAVDLTDTTSPARGAVIEFEEDTLVESPTLPFVAPCTPTWPDQFAGFCPMSPDGQQNNSFSPVEAELGTTGGLSEARDGRS